MAPDEAHPPGPSARMVRPRRRVLPRPYYGWVIVLALSVTETTSWGILYYTFSVFLRPMEEELRWSRSELTGAFSLALLVSAAAALPTGRWLDRHGARGLMTLGSVAATLLVLAWSRVHSLGGFYLVWLAIGVTMAAVLYEPAFAVITAWFDRSRARALTVLTLFGGLASTIFIPLAHALLEARGWRSALVVLAGILGAITVPVHALALKRHPHDLGLTLDGVTPPPPGSRGDPPTRPSLSLRRALRSVGFWAFTGALVLSGLATAAISVHAIPYLIERGYPSGFAATAAGLIGAMQLPGRALFAPVRAWVPRRWLTASIFLVQGVAIGTLASAESRSAVWLFVVLFGMSAGMVTLARAATLADLFGAAHYGTLSGVVGACSTAARALGPVGAALLYETRGHYEVVLWTLVGALTLAGLGGYLAEATAAPDDGGGRG